MDIPCQCTGISAVDEYGCLCDPRERHVRAVMNGRADMTDELRESCLEDILSTEGYSQSDVDGAADADLARTTINAWTDYARDKGLIR